MKLNCTDWFQNAGWGVFIHYILTGDVPTERWNASVDTSAESWNAIVDGFDVDALSDQLEQIRPGYCFLTIGQNSGHYCAPNQTYDSIVGIQPSKCSRRDLVTDLSDALAKRSIPLLVYLPSGAPDKDEVAMRKLQWQSGTQLSSYRPIHGLDEDGKPWGSLNPPNIEFQRNWEAIIREWSLRWGDKIAGWWYDGCYFSDAMYRNPTPPNFQSFTAAAKAGNPDSIIAFSHGVNLPIKSLTDDEDYTGGEISSSFPVCPGRWVDDAQYHVLSYLGETWGGGQPRLADEFVISYTRHVIDKKGVVTWDVPVAVDGTIEKPFAKQLNSLSQNLKGVKYDAT